MLDFTFQGADKEQESGLELALVSGCPPRSCRNPDSLLLLSHHSGQFPTRQKHPGRGSAHPRQSSAFSLQPEVATAPHGWQPRDAAGSLLTTFTAAPLLYINCPQSPLQALAPSPAGPSLVPVLRSDPAPLLHQPPDLCANHSTTLPVVSDGGQVHGCPSTEAIALPWSLQ